MVPALALVLIAGAVAAVQELCREPVDCAAARTSLCGSAGDPLERKDSVVLCLGFQHPGGPSDAGSKALFRVQVDSYSTLSVDTLRPLMDAEWDERKAAHSELWVGMNGRRTIGQQRGLWSAERGGCNATSAAPSSGQSVCYGWAEHNKPVVTPDFYLSTGLTVIIHLDQGVVNRMVWDSSCNLCAHGGSDEVSCEWDRSNTTCPGESGQCSDCYAHLLPGACGADATVCTPKIYVAWLGTDKHGQPLLSAGSVLSRFAEYALAGVTNLVVDEISKLGEEFQ